MLWGEAQILLKSNSQCSEFKKCCHDTRKELVTILIVAHFRPSVEMTKVTPILLASFPLNVQSVIAQNITQSGSVLDASSVCLDRIKYHPGMILSTGSCSGHPEFAQIEKIVSQKFCLSATIWQNGTVSIWDRTNFSAVMSPQCVWLGCHSWMISSPYQHTRCKENLR